ncbi:MAG TPA: hypothetical protein VLL54_20350 [Pyrinomonadaceae bacterium]|nr:hypothetical protein [Pyrinomonadaceae bacterium]
MSSTFQTGARIFPCASCGEMIYSDSATCRFCNAPVDRYAAEAAADNQKKVNNAVNLSKWIRNSAGVLWLLVAVGLVLGIAQLGAFFLDFGIPVSLIYWQISFASLKTPDPDFAKTKRDRLIALLLWFGACVVQVIIIVAQVLL